METSLPAAHLLLRSTTSSVHLWMDALSLVFALIILFLFENQKPAIKLN